MSWQNTVRCIITLTVVGLTPVAGMGQTSSVDGTIVDALGGRVDATVRLHKNGELVGEVRTGPGGTYVFSGLEPGRYEVEAAATGFESTVSEPIFLGASDAVTSDVLIQIGRLEQHVSVTAAAAALPLARLGAPVSILDRTFIEQLAKPDVLEALRTVPGLSVVQTGPRGGTTSVFMRGGDANFAKVLIDGAPANDMGGDFDFDALSTSAVESVEILRTANSVLYGSDAMSGVINVETRKGQTRVPEVSYAVDGGNNGTFHTELSAGQAIGRFDYFLSGSRFDTDNDLPNNEYRNDTFAGRFGFFVGTSTRVSATLRRTETHFETPNAILYFGIPDDSSDRVRQTYASITATSEMTPARATLRYAYTRKNQVFGNLTPTGEPYDPFDSGFPSYLGDRVTIVGENGFSVTGRAILDFCCTFGPSTFSFDTRRHIFSGQADVDITPAAAISFGGRLEDEEGGTVHRRNHGYFVEGRGNVGRRLYATGGFGFEDHAVIGYEFVPRLSLALYARRPSRSAVGETKLILTIGKGIKAPDTFEEGSSLFALLRNTPNGLDVIRQFHVTPIDAERTWNLDAGVEQVFWDGHGRTRISYFNNHNDDLVEGVGVGGMTQLGIPQDVIDASGGFAYVNSQSFDAQGIEFSGDIALGSSLRISGWYMFLDAEIKEALSVSPSFNPAFPDIPIGQFSPLVGARPFRRPTHSGSLTLVYLGGPALISLTGSFVGHQDDSTYLFDPSFGPSMLLPNKNLTGNYQKLDLSASYPIHRRAKWYMTVENLLNQDYFASGGFPGLPINVRSGVKFTLGGDPL